MSQKQILIVDDEVAILNSLRGALNDEGYFVRTATNASMALAEIEREPPELVLLDIWMPGGKDGLETLKAIKEMKPHLPVIMMSGHGTIETAVRATKGGAIDFVEKPINLDRLLVLLQNVYAIVELSRENDALRKQVHRTRSLIGKSSAIEQIRDFVRRAAPTTGSVLITGENGTGKEVVAQSVHLESTRFSKPFIEVNCAAIPEDLIESELFGHEKGAFTGATQLKRGKFDLADQGTLFLDEIGDMSLKTQAKILRILQEQKFERVGGTQTNTVDVRVIAATNKDLRLEIQKGSFREDLFYRLNVVPIHIPPLRDRSEDVPLLAKAFLAESCISHGRKLCEFDDAAFDVLMAYKWPGNVRELKNLVERIVILMLESEEGKPIRGAQVLGHIKDFEYTPREVKNLRGARLEFEKDFICKTLRESDWNVSKAAMALGIERSHLHRKIKSYGIEGG